MTGSTNKYGRRAVIIVMDSVGVGSLPDASLYGDEGANTFKTLKSAVGDIKIPNLKSLGFMSSAGFGGGADNGKVCSAYGRSMEKSVGKDTITGHWEIAGIITDTPFQTFTDTGFPEEFIRQFEERIGTEVLGNYSASGTEIIKELGPEHKRTGYPIVYTSADSVFQIAADNDVIPLERLYEMCGIAREMLQGEWLVGRVIARPYVTDGDVYTRTSDRRDYAVDPPSETILDMIAGSGKTVCAIGKISDIFNGRGITESIHTNDNSDGMAKTVDAMGRVEEGLIFTNLVDFDAKFGHRRDASGYARALEEFDGELPGVLEALRDDDLLVLCADHGNDPNHTGWNHTREYVPVIFASRMFEKSVDLGTLDTFADIGATVCDWLGVELPEAGTSKLPVISEKK